LSGPGLSERKKPDLSGFFLFLKQAKCVKKSQNFKLWFQKRQIGNPEYRQSTQKTMRLRHLLVILLQK